jgi:hypothetical protein
MENGEIVRPDKNNTKEGKTTAPVNLLEMEVIFANFSKEAQVELKKYWSKFPPEIKKKVLESLGIEVDTSKSEFAKAWDKMEKEDRLRYGEYRREDLKDFNEIDLEIDLTNSIYKVFNQDIIITDNEFRE